MGESFLVFVWTCILHASLVLLGQSHMFFFFIEL